MRVWVGLLVGCAMGCETSPMDSGDGDSPGGAQSDSDSVSTEDSTDGSDTGSDRDADSDRDSGPDTDITTDSDTESDSDSDTGEPWPTLMCDDTLGIRPPFRLTGDDWNDLDGRVNYEYELVFPVGEPNNAVVPSCDPNPPNYPHDREPGGYQFVYGSEIRMEVWLEAGEQVRVTEDGALPEAISPMKEPVYYLVMTMGVPKMMVINMSIVGPIGGIPGAQVPAFCAVRRHWAINHIRVPIRLIGDHIIIHRRERFLEHVGIPRIPALAIAIVYEVGDAVFIPRGAVGLSIRSASTRPLDGASTHTSAVLGRTYREKFQTVCIPLPESMR